MADRCKSCGAEITWIETEQGKKAPLNARPQHMWVEIEGQGWQIKPCFTSHFATCPDADKFRKSIINPKSAEEPEF